jgi:predicted N-acyltransferase
MNYDGRGTINSVTTASAIPDDQWSALVPHQSVYATKQWYLATERHPGIQPLYLTYRDAQGKMSGLARICYAATPYMQSLDPVHVLGDVLQASTPEKWWPCLFVGNRGNPNELIAANGAKWGDGHPAIGALATAIREVAAMHDLPIVSMYMPERDARLLQEALGPGAIRLKSGTNSELDTRYTSMDDYLGRLSSSRRYAMRKEMRRFWNAGYSVTIGNLADSLSEIAPLISNVDRKHDAPISTEQRRAALEQQAQLLSDRSVVHLCRNPKGELVACSLMYRNGTALCAPHVGIDYRRVQDSFEYFNVYIYLPLGYAIVKGVASINQGFITEAKRRRGARPVPVYSVLWRSDWPTKDVTERAAKWNLQE